MGSGRGTRLVIGSILETTKKFVVQECQYFPPSFSPDRAVELVVEGANRRAYLGQRDNSGASEASMRPTITEVEPAVPGAASLTVRERSQNARR